MNENQWKMSLSLLFFWIKGSIKIDQRFVRVNLANTVLGIIPAGMNEQNIPLKNISAVVVSKKFKLLPMVIGLLIALAGLSLLGEDFIPALVMLVIGVLLFGSGIRTAMAIERSGGTVVIVVPFYEKAKLDVIAAEINEMLANDADKTDLGKYFDKK